MPVKNAVKSIMINKKRPIKALYNNALKGFLVRIEKIISKTKYTAATTIKIILIKSKLTTPNLIKIMYF